MPNTRRYAAAGIAAALAVSAGVVAVTNGTATAESPVRDVIAVPSRNGGPNVTYVVAGDTATGAPHEVDDLRTGNVQSTAIAPMTNVVAYAAQWVKDVNQPSGDTPRGIMLGNPDGSGHRWLVAPRSGIDVFDVSWNVVGTKLLWSQQRSAGRTSYLWMLDVTKRGAQPTVVDGSADIHQASFSRRTFHTIVGASPAGLVTLTDGVRVEPDGRMHWTLPRDIDFSHVVIRRYYTADAFPGPTDGALVYAGRGTTFTDTVERGRTILWGVFVVDGSGNASEGAFARLDG